MDRVEFIGKILTFCEDNSVKVKDVMVSHGGAMVLMGLRDKTNDVDLHVTQKVWDKFPDVEAVDLGGGVYLKSVTDDIGIHIGGFDDESIKDSIVSPFMGIRHRGLNDTLNDYLRLGRDKDKETIHALRQAAATKPIADILNLNDNVSETILRYDEDDFGVSEGFYGSAVLNKVPASVTVIKVGGYWTYVITDGSNTVSGGIGRMVVEEVKDID